MARKFKFCLHCRRTITESMIARGEFARTKYGMICGACAERLNAEQQEEEQEAAPAAPPPPPEPEPSPEPPTDKAVPPVIEAPVPSPPPPPAPEPEPQPEPPVAGPAPAMKTLSNEETAAPLAEMHQHVEAIHRILMFERSSPWNILATVTQCLAAGVLLIALFNWIENPQGVLNILLVALILQVMALTFYVKGK